MKVAVGLRRVAAGKRTSGRRAAQIAPGKFRPYRHIQSMTGVFILRHMRRQ